MWVGPYEVLTEIGRGGVGVVYKGVAPSGAPVAVKLLRRGTRPEVLARFERERRLLASLAEADGFVPLVDAGESQSGPFLVMPFVGGGTLRDRLARGPLSIEETLDLGRRLARALGVAHARGIVHRDLKPENVLVTEDGLPLIADLGLAKHFHLDSPGASQSVSLSRTGELRGTAGYMAPEQAQDAGAAGPEADVFALGAILYECLTGVRAFEGLSVLDLLEKVMSGDVAPITAYRSDVPRWLRRAVERALAHDPGKRFEDGSAFGRALVEPPRRVGRGVVVVVGLLAVAGAAVGFVTLRAAPRAGKPPPPREPAPPEDRRAKAARLAEEAKALSVAGKAGEALARANSAVELDPGSATAVYVRGVMRLFLNEDAGARADFDRVLELDPTSAMALANRALLKQRAGDLDGAIADATRGIEIDPAPANLWGNRGRARLDKGDLDGAIADLGRAIEHGPIAQFYGNRGLARLRKGDLRGALADDEKGVALDPGDAVVWAGLGRVRGDLGDHAGAIEACARAIELDPRQGSAWANRGASRLALRDFDRAIEDETKAIDIDPKNAGAWANRGFAKRYKGDPAGAIPDFERFLELQPSGPDAETVTATLVTLRAGKP
jgi:tetratricopeptide (TPR) repeat protein/predicted Ser/Thr protein kinase